MVSFTETPSEAKFSNNKSALTYSAFVQTAIKGMLLSETMKQLKTSPRSYHSSFCVSVNLKDKKQLVLDLGYLFKFDLKNGYHLINIFQPHQTYLGFSRVFNCTTKYFILTVLPFGLSTVPFVFTEVVHPLVKFWRFHSIKLACFLDGGLGIEYKFLKACNNSNFVRYTLTEVGFISSLNKSVWTP